MKSKFFEKKNFQTSAYFTTIGFVGIILMKNPEYAFYIAAGSIIIGFIFLVIACFEKLITKSKSSLEKGNKEKADNEIKNEARFTMKSKFFERKNFRMSAFFTTIGILALMIMNHPEYVFYIAAGSMIIGFIFLVIACFEKPKPAQ